ncbi:hypothetical protein [Gloeocapsa sp. PCC 73106]|uniref:hypothetical protein n=1 Tax=Gloeocapsa sp. PCC 73106 TaxID=102232 RepID=UPI0002AD006E|nr:hypothetical protein [Gloeocapsa sp. PCC 73106]ELR98861.1 hypothetical protein GLO73106DRAFT_00026990 [Gloeocapsa sp. PCC 73106]
MTQIKIWLISLICIASFFISYPVLADSMAKKSPDYPPLVENLNQLLGFQANPEQNGYTSQELQKKIDNFKLQKYVLETSEDWGVCRNETDKILGIYGRQPKKPVQDILFYLAAGEETDDSWDCQGIYIPSDTKVASLDVITGEPSVLKIVDGTKLVVTSNPDTGELSLNVPSGLVEVIPFGDTNQSIPNLAQADIDAQTPNAPTD